jgi:hypothetical protein
MRVSKKSLVLTLCLVLSISASAPAFAAGRERDGGNPRSPIARIIQVVKRLLSSRDDILVVPIPAPAPPSIP